MLTEHLFTSREELFEQAADRCKALLESGLSENGKASFVVPGGTTPAPVFERLSKQPLDWKKIQIAVSDERWLDATHDQSNQRLIETTLLINHAKNAQLIAMKNSKATAAAGEAECEQLYQTLHSPIDVVMLGMGSDGHFASLFPGTPQIQQALDLETKKNCIAIDATGCEIAGSYTQRMSMTLHAITQTKLVILLFTGEEKLKVLRAAKQASDSLKLPVSALFNQTRADVEVFWAP